MTLKTETATIQRLRSDSVTASPRRSFVCFLRTGKPERSVLREGILHVSTNSGFAPSIPDQSTSRHAR